MPLCLVLCTFPDLATAQRTATALVEAKLAACVNLLPGAESIYRWQGKLESSREVLVLIKTTEAAYAQLEAKLKELHPYDVPEIIALPVPQALQAYAQWVEESTARASETADAPRLCTQG